MDLQPLLLCFSFHFHVRTRRNFQVVVQLNPVSLAESVYRDDIQTYLVFQPFTELAHKQTLTTVKIYNSFPVGRGSRSGRGGNQRAMRGCETDELVLMQMQ